MTIPNNLQALDKLADMCNSNVTYPDNHFLGLPHELKARIYEQILTDIQHRPRIWNKKSNTDYDSLLLVCRQLHLETSQNIFLNRVTKRSLHQVLGLLPNRTNVSLLRALDLQVSHQADHHTIQCITTMLDKFQLSVQELHLSFYGQDLHGNTIDTIGCGYARGLPSDTLPPSGQEVNKAFALLRQITNLRNLRVLRISNMNLPVIQYVLFASKANLQAVSFTTDSRAQACDLRKLYKRRPDLFRGLLGKPLIKPSVKVLELDANAIIPAQVVVNTLAPALEHFSWRVPNYDYQFEPETTLTSFEHITDAIIRNLSVQAPDLKTLRLCITRSAADPQRPTPSWEISASSQTLTQYLSSYMSLEHFEIHDSRADNFYSNTLVKSLPFNLKRLYISDRLIGMDALVKCVRKRYITADSNEEVDSNLVHDEEPACVRDFDPLQEAVFMSISQRGHTRFLKASEVEVGAFTGSQLLIERSLHKSDDYIAEGVVLGEAQNREDRIPLQTGKLGFITFDYDISADEHHSVKCGKNESTRTRIFRLNGQLLDREHNMHLAASQESYPILENGTRSDESTDSSGDQSQSADETGSFSAHPEIHQALYDMTQLKWHPQHVGEITKDLEECFNKSINWYFGTEDEAEEVFRRELAAPVQGQKQKSMLIEVEDIPTKRCRWSAPEYVVPPVGSFPAPVAPRGWRDDIQKSYPKNT